jgi:hypothetical protein
MTSMIIPEYLISSGSYSYSSSVNIYHDLSRSQCVSHSRSPYHDLQGSNQNILFLIAEVQVLIMIGFTP